VPCLIGAGWAVPTDRRAAVSTVLDFPIYTTCVYSVCGSLAAIQPLFAVVAHVVVLVQVATMAIFVTLCRIRASAAIIIVFSTFSAQELEKLNKSFFCHFLFPPVICFCVS
jgi:hypothetical protein